MLYTHAFATGYVWLWTYVFAPMMALCFRQYIADEIKIVTRNPDEVEQGRDMYRRCLKLSAVMIFLFVLPFVLGLIFDLLGFLSAEYPSVKDKQFFHDNDFNPVPHSRFDDIVFARIACSVSITGVYIFVLNLVIATFKVRAMCKIILHPDIFPFLTDKRYRHYKKINFVTSWAHGYERIWVWPILPAVITDSQASLFRGETYLFIHILCFGLICYFYMLHSGLGTIYYRNFFFNSNNK